MQTFWRKFNGIRAILWLVIAPAAWFFGWVSNIAFVSYVSLYANWASDMAAWRSDVNPHQEQLDRLEEKLDRILSQLGESVDLNNT